jgi:hypothetical protein
LRGLARGDDLCSGAGVDVRELRLRDDLGGDRLRLLGDCLGVVDLNEHGTFSDVLAAHDRDLSNTPVDPRGDVEPRRIDLALHQQRHRPHQVPDRQASDNGNDCADKDRWKSRRRWLWRLARLLELRRLS